MTLAQLSNVTFGYPGTDLFEGVSWQITAGSRIGLVGPNGAGKSTLLRLLTGEVVPDEGQVVRARGVSVGYLHQSQEHGRGRSLLDALMAPFAEVLTLRAELHEAERALAQDASPQQMARYATLTERYTMKEGYSLEARVRMLAADVGFAEADLERDIATLSGGERGRLELAKVLLSEPDLLLLDEPTNHLDLEATLRLETRLSAYPPAKAYVIVSHDRAFLQATCHSIVDVGSLAPGSIDHYAMRYVDYVVEREQRRERALAEFTRQQQEIARQEEFIRRNIAGQKTNQAKSRRKMLAKLDRIDRPEDAWRAAGRIGLRFTAGVPGPKEVARIEEGAIGYEGVTLARNIGFTIYRGDRIGFIGPNGAGKTTLLRALIGQLPLLSGTLARGQNLSIGYYDQKHRDLEEERSLVEEIQSLRADWTPDPIRNYLARFRFFGDDGFRKVKGLSGGERSRLALAKMMLVPHNLLALDEPTNHLDIPAREALEEALSGYDGTLLCVSHDRYFLDRVVTKILLVDRGKAELHLGNYSEVKQRLERAAAERPAPKPVPAPERKERIVEHEANRQAKRKREQQERRLATLESQIAELEAQHTELKQALAADPGGDWKRVHALVEEEQALEGRLQRLIEEWESLGKALEVPDA